MALDSLRPQYQPNNRFLCFWRVLGARGARNRPGLPGRPATLIFNEAGWGTTRGAPSDAQKIASKMAHCYCGRKKMNECIADRRCACYPGPSSTRGLGRGEAASAGRLTQAGANEVTGQKPATPSIPALFIRPACPARARHDYGRTSRASGRCGLARSGRAARCSPVGRCLC